MNAMSSGSQLSEAAWKGIYRSGGIAAILAGAIFRRNLGVEAALFRAVEPPTAPGEWFHLLQTRRLLGLTYLGIFDVVNGILVGWMLLCVCAALRRTHLGRLAAAAFLGLLGVVLCAASNTALSMLALSEAYAGAVAETQRTLLLAAGQGLLALNRFGTGAHPGSGGYASLALIALSGLILSTLMPRGGQFPRRVAVAGILANALDLLYCLVYPFAPAGVARQVALVCIPAAGLFAMLWHLMVGWSLLQRASYTRDNTLF